MWKKITTMALMAVCMAVLVSPATSQDKVQALEERIQAMEAQLNEMKAMLQETQEAAKAEPAAEEAAAEEQPALTKLIGPGGTLRIGGDIRFRGLFFDNVWNMNDASDSDQREVFRFRPRVFFDWKPTDDVEAYVRMTKEWFYGQDNERLDYYVEAKDVMFDNAWGQWSNMFGLPLTARIGRQDLIYGDGFVILDGTPQDGSQTISFDAAKLTLAHEWGSSDLLYAKLSEGGYQDSDDEDLYGIYNKFKFEEYNLGVEPYFLVRNKNDAPDFSGFSHPKANPDPTTGQPYPATYPFAPYDPSPKEQTYMFGLRATYDLDITDGVNLALAAEGGKQWGNVDFTGSPLWVADPTRPGALVDQSKGFSRYTGDDTVERDAWGGQLHGTLSLNNVNWKPSVKAGVSYMSGDDPKTDEYEGWDDFYAQWPKYSELYVYSLYDGFKFANRGLDPDVGLWSNMIIPEVMLTVKPTDRWTQSLRYLYFLADEDRTGFGNERGHNLQWLSNYVFTKNLSGHFLFEYFEPGDYYGSGADAAMFTRFQIMYTF